MNGLGLNSAGVLYGIQSSGHAVLAFGTNLFTLNTLTGAPTLVGDTGFDKFNRPDLPGYDANPASRRRLAPRLWPPGPGGMAKALPRISTRARVERRT
jgi:hypothetical protein